MEWIGWCGSLGGLELSDWTDESSATRMAPGDTPRRGARADGNRPVPLSPLPLKSMVGQSVALLAVGGIFLYGLMSLAYDAFYRRLGVDLGDVGLTYGGVLARSTGFAALLLFGAVLLVCTPIVIQSHTPSVYASNMVQNVVTIDGTSDRFFANSADAPVCCHVLWRR